MSKSDILDDIEVVSKKDKTEQKFKPSVGIDIGTATIVVSRQTEDGHFVNKYHRNMLFELEISDESQDLLDRSNYLFVKTDNKIYIVGDDALKIANALGHGEIIRPMKDGLLNVNLREASELLFYIIKAVLGDPIIKNENLRFSLPSNPIDKEIDNLFHKTVLQSFFTKMGYSAKPLNEAVAIAYDQNPLAKLDNEIVPLTGLTMSFGAGMTNVALILKGMELGSFSITKSGDYLDESVAKVTGTMKSKVIKRKEKDLDLNNIDINDRILSALCIYYEEVIDRVVGIANKEFAIRGAEIDGEIEVVVAGGTAMATGFCKKLDDAIKKSKLPFNIYQTRLSNTPFFSVANGCCIRALADLEKTKSKSSE